METYRHSGAISPIGIIIASTTGIVAASILGVIYSFAMVNIPSAKLHFLLPIGLGALIGVAVGWGAKIGKIRNLFVAAAYGFLCGLVGLYVAWGADLIARVIIPGKIPMDYLTAFSPSVLCDYIKQFYENGAWALKGGGNVSGLFLGILWTLEALIVVGFSTVLATCWIDDLPFCENCNRWTVVKPIKKDLSLRNSQETLPALLEGDLSGLPKFPLAQNENLYLQFELASCPSCEESHYLTIYNVTKSLDNKGKENIERKVLIRNMRIAAEDVPLINEAGYIG